jgi:hypothetical protein
MNNLAVVLNNQGKYREVEAMERQTLALKEKVLSKEHPDMLLRICCLVHSLAKRDSFVEATTLYQRACEGYSSVLNSTNSAYTEENLGILYAPLFYLLILYGPYTVRFVLCNTAAPNAHVTNTQASP